MSTSDVKVSSPRSGFRREADMLLPLQQHLDVVVPGTVDPSSVAAWQVLFEVPTASGVVDVLYVAFDDHVVTSRREANHAPIIEWHELRVFAALQSSAGRAVPLAELALRVGMTRSGLRRGALSRLAASGHVDVTDRESVMPTWSYQPPARTLVAVEAKLRDWRRATSQARRYTSFADQSFIAVESNVAARALEQRKIIASSGVGILAVDSSSRRVRTLVTAPVHLPKILHRMFAAEQALWVTWEGRVSGPVPLVYGRLLTTSEGTDPRFGLLQLNSGAG